MVQMNAQLRNQAVREPEARMQQYLLLTMECSEVTDEYTDQVKAHFKPVYSSTSSSYTPEKRGRPEPDAQVVPKVSVFACNRGRLVQHYQPLVDAIKANPSISDSEMLTAESVVQSLELADNHILNYQQDGDAWPGPTFIKNKYGQSNMVPICPSAQGRGESGNNDTSQGDTSQGTELTTSTLEDWLGEQLADY